MKRFFALMLALTLSLTLLQGVAFGAVDTILTVPVNVENNGFTSIVSMKVKVLAMPNGSTPGAVQVGDGSGSPSINSVFDGTLTIPATVIDGANTYTVTSIGTNGFYGCSLDSITIPAGVTTIGANAFQNCSSLKTVTFEAGSKLETIEVGAFNGCEILDSIYLPAGLKVIEMMAFKNCFDLGSINIPAGVTTIESGTFFYCADLKTVTFEAGSKLETIGDAAFDNCGALGSITIPAGVTTIEANAFGNCSDLSAITIPAGVTTIGANAFNNCSDLGSITFNGTTTGIDSNAFGTFGVKAPLLDTVRFAGNYVSGSTDTMINALKTAITNAGRTPTIYYNQSAAGWDPDGIAALKTAGFTVHVDLTPTPAPTSGGSGGGSGTALHAYYPGDGTPYTQIVDSTATTAMLQQGSVVNVVGQSPTGIIVKFAPTALSGQGTVTINNSIQNVTLTAAQIANLVAQADGGVIYVTIKQTADGVSLSASAGVQTVSL